MANFAIMGFGTVGSGVAEVLRMNAASIAKKLGEPLNLKYILDVRDLSATPYGEIAVKDFSVLENDPDLDVVVESIGGAKVALEFTRRALLAGKHVVTSNKELVASYGKELLNIAREKNVNYLFEASVGGGIPVLRPLFQCLAGNQIEEVVGILNGTTNYILTRMVKGGVSFEDALKEAQTKGYAEQNPAADVEGLDAGRKICILSNLAWGKEVLPERIHTQGISGLDLQDVAIAGKAGYRVKIDDSEKSPGWKFSEQEMLGIPTRIEIGPKDIEKNQVVVVRRDTREKMVVSLDEIAGKLRDILETIQQDMYHRAEEFLNSHIYTATTLDEMKEKFIANRGFVKACWCGDPECEGEVKYVTGGAATRCLIEDEEFVSDKCIWCGKPAKHMAYWGKSY